MTELHPLLARLELGKLLDNDFNTRLHGFIDQVHMYSIRAIESKFVRRLNHTLTAIASCNVGDVVQHALLSCMLSISNP